MPNSKSKYHCKESKMKKLIISLILIFFVIISVAIFCSKSSKQDTKIPQTIKVPITDSKTLDNSENSLPDLKILIGTWQRTDGNYTIIIEAEKESNQLTAKYYNPRPINVSKSDFKMQNSNIIVFLELNDEGYPGCTYKLRYNKYKDTLSGDYFQAALNQTFSIEFKRCNHE